MAISTEIGHSRAERSVRVLPSRRLGLRGAMCLGIVLVLAGCGGDRHPGSVERVPLTGGLVHAAVIAANPDLDLRAEQEPAAPPPGLGIVLDTGWGPPEPFGRWVVGTHAIATVFLPDDRPRRLMVECRRFPANGVGAPQSVCVLLNGHEVGRAELQAGWRSLEWDLSGEALNDGANRIELDFSSAISPFDFGKGSDHRRIAAGVRRIALAPVASDPARADSRPPSVAARMVMPISLSAAGGRIELHMQTTPSGPDPLSLELFDLDGRSTRLEPEVAVREDGRWIVATLPADPPPLDFLVIGSDHEATALSRLELVRRTTGDTGARAEARTTPQPAATPPDVVVVIGDALRPDHLGYMGYPRDTSPFLDSLARESLVFPNAVATASYSLASVATILSGLSPFHHRVVQREDRLTDDVETIAEHFQAHGYATLGLSANGYHSPQFGSDQGYEQFLMMWRVCNGSPECTSDPHQAVRAVLDTLEGGFADDRPLFLLLHVVPPHSPYDPPPVFDVFTDPDYEGPASGDVDYLHRVIDGRETPSDRDVEHLVALYDGNIRRLDDAVERLLQGLSEVRDRQRETAVVFIADHGEAFGDHGWFGHSGTVYDEMVRVPFILRLPDVRDAGPVDTTQLASLEDVLPTLLDVAGLPPPTRCDGVDLLAPSSKASRDARVVLMRNALDDRLELGVRSRRWKAVVRGTEKRQLFDLSADPRENHNLAGDRRELLGGFEALLAASFTWGNHAGVPILPDAEANALRALGYVDHD